MNYTSVGAVSLGCSKNAVDTEIMLGELSRLGFKVGAGADEAEIIIVNTCGFIESAKQDSLDAILEMAQYKKSGACRLLVVTGCLSQRYPKELREELPEVDLFWGVKDYPALARKLFELAGGEGEGKAKNSRDSSRTIICGDSARLLTTPPFRAYLRIADGCDNRCTYCAIPLIRGGRRSVPMEKLLDEAAALADSGVSELTVIAQDTSAYGTELYGKPMLRELLLKLAEIEKLHWIRVLYAYPNTIDRALVDTIAGEKKLCAYIDMPIQHISERMLRAMNRHGSGAHIREITDYIRSVSPDFILRTTVMTGFPGETEADHRELLRFLSEHPFDRVGAFTYSAEDGTPAASMPDQVPHELAERRLDELMRLQMDISKKLNERRVGSTVEALVESIELENDGSFTALARSYAEAADVDGMLLVRGKGIENLPMPGEYVNAKLTAAKEYDLEGEIL
ncbi:MAG: 30S ribosomal protein S12 methylthiotransferase RimO [Clostridia bacterium]|nr:30S ribosomal protein S12 methylthiotransferase RimO [Clostridia bacterium]